MNLSLPNAPIYLDLHPAAHRRTVQQQIFFNLHRKQLRHPPKNILIIYIYTVIHSKNHKTILRPKINNYTDRTLDVIFSRFKVFCSQ